MIVLLALALLCPAAAADTEPTHDTAAEHDGQDVEQTDPQSPQEAQETDQESDAAAAGEGNETDQAEEAQESDAPREGEPSPDDVGEGGDEEEQEGSRESSRRENAGPGAKAWHATPGAARWAVRTTVDHLDIPLPQPSGCNWYTWYGMNPKVETDPLLGMIVLTPMDCINRIIDGPASTVGPPSWW